MECEQTASQRDLAPQGCEKPEKKLGSSQSTKEKQQLAKGMTTGGDSKPSLREMCQLEEAHIIHVLRMSWLLSPHVSEGLRTSRV